ncbi:MAG TPA: HNH endonuclease [Terriglobia bacterium]|nr:HNH endonuclease [Terriglobia bacterium]
MCAFCGATVNVDVHHIDGHEEHTEAANLAWACRSCNVRAAITMARDGLGRRTVQFNPASQGALSLAQWLTAVRSMKGEISDMDTNAAVELIHATPPHRRSEFAQQIWEIRRRHGTS